MNLFVEIKIHFVPSLRPKPLSLYRRVEDWDEALKETGKYAACSFTKKVVITRISEAKFVQMTKPGA